MRRWQVALCVIATVATVAAFWAACIWAHQQLLAIALFLVFVSLAALTY